MNQTIRTQLAHRTIRKFSDKPISSDIIDTLLDVAQQTASCSFQQSYSIISITDKALQQQIADICKQPYVGTAAHLFIFLVDQHRNQQIAAENGADTEVLGSMDRFMFGYADAVLATQNVVVAAESLEIGTVLLGSILNDTSALIELLNLPQHVFPVLGLALGYPDQEPTLKPRLPREIIHFENRYQQIDNMNQALEAYDAKVSEYYDLRDSNNRVDAFTKQITNAMAVKPEKRMAILTNMQKQGLVKF